MTFPIPKGVDTPLSVPAYMGAPLGIARDNPQHELQDTQCWMLRDVSLMDPGLLRRRGPLTELASSGKTTARPIGMARVQDPGGVEQMLVFVTASGGSSSYYGIQNTTSVTAGVWPYTMSVSPYELFDSKPTSTKGVMIGTAPKYDTPTNQAIAFWRGGSKADATNLATSSFSLGATTITVTSAIASCAVGHHVFNHANGALVGVISAIASNVITLEQPALQQNGACTAIDVQVLRGINPRVTAGSITCSTADAAFTVNGGATKFSAQGLATGQWDLYTPDMTWIGTVATVASDTQLALQAAPAVSLTNSAYVAIKTLGSYALNQSRVGWMNAAYAGHQFYADKNVLRFSDLGDPEAVDLTADGNSIIFSNDPIRAVVPTNSGLVILTETEAYELVGAVGTTPDRWRGEKIHTDGTICGMAAAAYGGGVIWPGTMGIWYFNGGTPQNIAATLGGDYRLFMKGFTSLTMRAYCGVVKDHYLCFVEGGTSGVFTVVTGTSGAQTTHQVTRPTFVINLNTGAQSLWENVELRGCIYPPDVMNLTTALLPITTLETAVAHVRVVDGEALFADTTGNDSWACEGGPGAGPSIYLETKLYNMSDPIRKKTWRRLLLTYLSVTGDLRLDTVAGMAKTSTQVVTHWPASSSFVTKRLPFTVRDQHLGFRIYQHDSSATRVILGAWGLGFKWLRAGRV